MVSGSAIKPWSLVLTTVILLSIFSTGAYAAGMTIKMGKTGTTTPAPEAVDTTPQQAWTAVTDAGSQVVRQADYYSTLNSIVGAGQFTQGQMSLAVLIIALISPIYAQIQGLESQVTIWTSNTNTRLNQMDLRLTQQDARIGSLQAGGASTSVSFGGTTTVAQDKTYKDTGQLLINLFLKWGDENADMWDPALGIASPIDEHGVKYTDDGWAGRTYDAVVWPGHHGDDNPGSMDISMDIYLDGIQGVGAYAGHGFQGTLEDAGFIITDVVRGKMSITYSGYEPDGTPLVSATFMVGEQTRTKEGQMETAVMYWLKDNLLAGTECTLDTKPVVMANAGQSSGYKWRMDVSCTGGAGDLPGKFAFSGFNYFDEAVFGFSDMTRDGNTFSLTFDGRPYEHRELSVVFS